MVEGRSKAVFKQWLANRPDAWREKVEVVAMAGFTGPRDASPSDPVGNIRHRAARILIRRHDHSIGLT